MDLTTSEQMLYTTIRIESVSSTGSISTGTGFFFAFHHNESIQNIIPVIVTNKHVIQDAVIGKFLFTLADSNGNPVDTEKIYFEVENFEKGWIKHKDDEVDLCCFPIGPIINFLKSQNQQIFFRHFTPEIIPSLEQMEKFDALEDLIMIGYPNGLWDDYNNKPILRRGITATHPNKDYCGKKEFMADIAAFPGSSGSPVLIYNKGSFSDRNGGFFAGTRAYLLGILYAGPQHSVTGEIEVVNIPTRQVPISRSTIPNNLGLIIKSQRIFELEQQLKNAMNSAHFESNL